MDCIFCKIVKGEAPAWRVYEDDDVVVVLDRYPASYGHLLVVTKAHHESVIDTPDDLVVKSFSVAARFARIWKGLGAKGVNIVTNAGREAGQVIFHYHVHVIPRWGDKLLWHGRDEIREETAREVVEKLKSALGAQK
ncbi:MAG: HIT domain-containing protein [Thermoproteus sp.]|jgi:histidine triad (HIT) family protein|uniref:HIT family protein n=1 Tax=Thermoproteus sp. CP80 TaxID=1650659 RepID=UPI0009BF4B09|nr:HIT domain-containing protein [Thermoproteus sp. CP80]MDT7868797.1 HIT domain-containing protein [Thermoproteus sp.]MDT7880990.1 HIT domain-containing protein [Thermoproteus sp.]PLC65812.1 HIT family hydrolase [Thermoproteus sp. CP80]